MTNFQTTTLLRSRLSSLKLTLKDVFRLLGSLFICVMLFPILSHADVTIESSEAEWDCRLIATGVVTCRTDTCWRYPVCEVRGCSVLTKTIVRVDYGMDPKAEIIDQRTNDGYCVPNQFHSLLGSDFDFIRPCSFEVKRGSEYDPHENPSWY